MLRGLGEVFEASGGAPLIDAGMAQRSVRAPGISKIPETFLPPDSDWGLTAYRLASSLPPVPQRAGRGRDRNDGTETNCRIHRA